jgi:hypothetical protein
MVAENLHLEKYHHNRRLLGETIFNVNKNIQNSDWAITIAFYCALHLVEKTIARSPHKEHQHLRCHEKRNHRVRIDGVFRAIVEDYQFLYNQSRRARYDCVSFTKADIADALVSLSNIEKLLVKKQAN